MSEWDSQIDFLFPSDLIIHQRERIRQGFLFNESDFSISVNILFNHFQPELLAESELRMDVHVQSNAIKLIINPFYGAALWGNSNPSQVAGYRSCLVGR